MSGIPSEADLAALEKANALLEHQLQLLNRCTQLRQRHSGSEQCGEIVDEISVNVRETIVVSGKEFRFDQAIGAGIEMGRGDSGFTENDIPLAATTLIGDSVLKIEGPTPPSHVSIATARSFMYALLKALHSYGAPSHRLETIIQALGDATSTPCSLYYLPTFLILHFHETSTAPAEFQLLRGRGGMNFSKLDPLYELCKRIMRKEMCHESAVATLENINGSTDPFQELMIVAMYPLSAFTSAIMFFHGGWKDAGMSALLACVPAALRLVANRWSFLWVSLLHML